MWTRLNDLESTFSVMNELRRRMDRAFEDSDVGRAWFDPSQTQSVYEAGQGSWPSTRLMDRGSQLVLRAEVPGLSEKEIQLTLNQDVLTLVGERRAVAPEGFSVHRQERPSVKFSRSFSCRHGWIRRRSRRRSGRAC